MTGRMSGQRLEEERARLDFLGRKALAREPRWVKTAQTQGGIAPRRRPPDSGSPEDPVRSVRTDARARFISRCQQHGTADTRSPAAFATSPLACTSVPKPGTALPPMETDPMGEVPRPCPAPPLAAEGCPMPGLVFAGGPCPVVARAGGKSDLRASACGQFETASDATECDAADTGPGRGPIEQRLPRASGCPCACGRINQSPLRLVLGQDVSPGKGRCLCRAGQARPACGRHCTIHTESFAPRTYKALHIASGTASLR